MNKPASTGFTLVEIAVVMTIIGVLVGSGILTFDSVLDDIRYNDTIKRQQDIAQALALFAQQHYFLPCPAEPSKFPQDGAPNVRFCNNYSNAPNSAVGIVPYSWLGLSQDQARDGYGNYFSYTVNFNFDEEIRSFHNIGPYNTFHTACLTTPTWFDLTGTHRNPRKASFCCNAQPVANDLRVFTNNSFSNQISPARVITGNTANYDFIPATAVMSSVVVTPSAQAYNTQTAVYVLVSHGRNGYGAFAVNGTRNRIAGPGATRLDEVVNESNGRNFVSRNLSDDSNNYFDDIVYWQTQDQLMSAFGRDSCARP